MPTRPPSIPASIGNKYFTRRALLKGAATLPLASLTATAQNTDSLWDSAMILIGSGGTLIGTDRVQCSLFGSNGKAVPGGTITVDASALATTGMANFKWEVQGGKLEGNFRLPDPNASHQQVMAFVPAHGGPPNRFYLLLSDDHLLVEDDPNFLAEGMFHGVGRLITKCQYLVEIDANGIPHPIAPFCTRCVYIFVGR
jgi:hypothetical protein